MSNGAGGRPTKYTEKTIKRIINAISMGASYKLAAAYGGISYETFNEWRKQYSEFSERVEKAEAKAAVFWLAKIEVAANRGNWQAAAWKLERRYPEVYGRQVREVTGRDGGPITWRQIVERAMAEDSDSEAIEDV